MKLRNFIYALTGLSLASAVCACDSEKDLIIIDGDLPIKTSTLYMVGDATPNGWNIDSPSQLAATEEDPLVFRWEGDLNPGEMKLCLTTGSWDTGFIRPFADSNEIGMNEIKNAKFQMYAGDPDEKWRVTEAGVYLLSFDLRNWTMSSSYLHGQDIPEKEPLVAESLYIVGDAVPAGWNIDDPTPLEKKSDYVFEYRGRLDVGEMKAYIEKGDWGANAIRPVVDGCSIGRDGVESNGFVFTASPDNKWKVEEAAIYRLTFNLKDWTVSAEAIGDYKPTPKIYMIGEATEGGWSLDNATVIEAAADNDKIFIWTGELGCGTFKAAEVKDFNSPFYRPAIQNCEVSASGVADSRMVFTESPDDQWFVTLAGKYTLTFNTEDMTFDAEYIGDVLSE
ncbi:MAG: SusF/SusE family outer membrane protein [Bacteroides sp.]|nr:SusF/SusE family outer membrane protein [Bacteroides sp.]